MTNHLHLKGIVPVKALQAGHFISRGIGWHPQRVMDSFEIIYVNSGSLGIYEDDQAYEVEAGHAIILFPGIEQGGTRPFDKNLSFYWMHFLPEEKAEDIGERIMSLPQIIRLAKPDQFVELFRRFIRRQERDPYNTTIRNLILLEILCELSDSTFPMEVTTQKVVLATRADEYIRLHLNEPLSSSILAESLGCNADYLGRVFQQIHKKTLTDAIHEHRLNRASRLLIESVYNINEIARQCGYTDPDYFRRTFKKYRGMSPRHYRQTYCLVTTAIDET